MNPFRLSALLALLLVVCGSELSAQETTTKPDLPAAVAEEPILEMFELTEDALPTYDGAAFARLVVYPEDARKNGVEGNVIVEFVVETDGRTSGLTIVRSDSPVLDQPSLDAVRQLAFTAGVKDGRPVRVRMTLPIRYSLD